MASVKSQIDIEIENIKDEAAEYGYTVNISVKRSVTGKYSANITINPDKLESVSYGYIGKDINWITSGIMRKEIIRDIRMSEALNNTTIDNILAIVQHHVDEDMFDSILDDIEAFGDGTVSY